MSDEQKPGIFKKIVDASEAVIDSVKRRAEHDLLEKAQKTENGADVVYSKSIVDEPTFQINSQGYKEKPHRLLSSHLKQMAYKDTAVSAVIQTRQNQVSNHSKLVRSEQDRGFMVILKDEEKFLRKIKEEIEAEMKSKSAKKEDKPEEVSVDSKIEKAINEKYSDQENEYSNADDGDDDEVEEFNWEVERKAKERLEDQIKARRARVEEFLVNGGELKDRPFETKKWTFDACLRAWVRDTLTYDLIATEKVLTESGDLHHIMPVDAGTIKFATQQLKKYKTFPGAQTNTDLLYPEKQLEYLDDKSDAFELDEETLENDEYKFVQVVRGTIERAYTEKEMCVGIRNLATDIFNNGYGICELELLIGIISSHLNTEYYNQAYFTQGFSAKGILHLKADIPRRKLETVRQQWHHMVKGTRNSFQTPIFAGMDEVNWIPLTQNHSDIEFSGWMNYLIKIICSIYQIDPYEIGIGMKDEGKGGSGLSGDNTEAKIDLSKDKGLYPLLRFLENYINSNVVDMIDPEFKIVFTGISSESKQEALERQEKEVKFKKTVNEIRAEDNLPPLPGMDAIILDPTYMQWYTQFSKEGKELAQQGMAPGMPGADQGQNPTDQESDIPQEEELDSMLTEEVPESPEDVNKSFSIEYYSLKK